MNKTVCVLMGGPDAERQISIQSGQSIAAALKKSNKFNVIEKIVARPNLKELQKIKCDVFFPALHGPFGEGGPLQVLLEQIDLPFVGSGSAVSKMAINKSESKKFAKKHNIATPEWSIIKCDSTLDFKLPIVLKPNSDGSSVGVSICHTDRDVMNNRNKLFEKHDSILMESYINGRELTVGIIEGEALPIIEIIPPNDLDTYDFEAKYERKDTAYIVNPDLPENNCVESALKIYNSMGIRDLARVDFLLDEEGAWFLEVNTMPGFTPHSLVPRAASAGGISMESLCISLVASALAR